MTCTVGGCPNTRIGLGQRMCKSHVISAVNAEKKEKAA